MKETKDRYLPKVLEVNKLGVKVSLISLLIQTTKSITKTLDEYELSGISGKKLELIGKWGIDGASSQQTTRQGWNVDEKSCTNETNNEKSNEFN